ncbi:MAG: deoxyribonuclease, partial [Alistipes finegoldii]|nr:deoxyribonuclease [Alistipes finegoldii]
GAGAADANGRGARGRAETDGESGRQAGGESGRRKRAAKPAKYGRRDEKWGS